MSFTTEVQNVNPEGAVTLFVDGESVTAGPGQTIKVSPEAAGEAPRWRQVKVDDVGAPTEPVDGMHTRRRAGHLEVFDLGSGLLAQPTNWRKPNDDSDPADPLDDGGGQLVDATDPGTEND